MNRQQNKAGHTIPNGSQLLEVGFRVKVNDDDRWYYVARVGKGYVTLHNHDGVVWFHSIADVRE